VLVTVNERMNRIVKEIHADRDLRNRLFEQFKRDGQPISRQALHAWKLLKFGVPVRRVPTVARVMRKKPYEIRPDIWKPPASAS
jgi:hypothetical protein